MNDPTVVPSSATTGKTAMLADVEAVLDSHSRRHEAKGRRFHHVNHECDANQPDLYPMGSGERGVFWWGDRSVACAFRLATRHQSVGRGGDAENDQSHADHHPVAHRHPGQPKTRFSTHPKHGQVQSDTDGHHDRTAPERDHVLRSGEERCLFLASHFCVTLTPVTSMRVHPKSRGCRKKCRFA